MNAEQQKLWDEACEMEKQYPGNPMVMMAAITIRQQILKDIGAVDTPQKTLDESWNSGN